MNDHNYNRNTPVPRFPNLHNAPHDTFDASADFNGNRTQSNLLNKSPNRTPPRTPPHLQSFENELSPYPVGITSPANSNVGTQGDIRSPKEENYRPANFGGILSNQYPTHLHQHDQRHEQRSYRNRFPMGGDGEGEIFSFRREGNARNDAYLRSHRNTDGARFPGEDEGPMSGRDYYDKTRALFTKLKKYYLFGLLNIACLILIIFNLSIAYSTENISFPKIEQIDAQFRQKVVLDIDLMPKSQSCSEPYVSSKMGTWPGYDHVCACPDSNLPRACNAEDFQHGCRNLESFEPIPIKFWDGRAICLRKSEKSLLGYYESSGFIENYSGNLLCPNGMKKCIVSSTQNFICVGRFEFCPITQIEIKNIKEQDKNSLKAQLSFDNKILVYDNQGSSATSFSDIIMEPQSCSSVSVTPRVDKYCSHEPYKKLLDSADEYKVIRDNVNASDFYESFQNSDVQMSLYIAPLSYLDLCVFNNTFNPVILNSQLSNWRAVRYLLFMNPFFISTLLVANILRALMIRYINSAAPERASQKRKKEIYNMFGRLFAGSSVVIITEVITILYYIFWGYLLLNPDRLIAEKWLLMDCISNDIKIEIQAMITEFTKVETFNMMTIGPMILGCIMEALFSQYRLIGTQGYSHVHGE